MIETDILSRQLTREKMARKEAEAIAEEKSRMLYHVNRDLIDKEKKTNAILETTADGIIVLDKNNKIEICNQAACLLFGYKLDELKGKNINVLINPVSHQELNSAVSSVLSQEKENILYEIDGLRKDKTTVPIELAISKMQLTQESFTICAVRNIFERKQQEQRLAVRHEITRIMAEYSSLDEITPKILKIICETMQLDEGALWKVDRTNNVLRCVSTWSVESKKVKKFADISEQFTFLPGIGLPGRVWKEKSSCWIADVTKDSNFPRAKYAQESDLHSAFALPIVFEEEALAVLEFFTHHLYPFNERLLSMLNDITYQIGIFIDREHAQMRVASLSRLTGMADVASSVLHNVGNSLNSINISCQMVYEKINHSKLENLPPLVQLLNQHKDDLGVFLVEHSSGQRIPEFLSRLSEELENEKKYLLDETNLLMKNVQHVKNIIMAQQLLSHTFGLTEITNISELLDDALTLNKSANERVTIKIAREFMPIKTVIIDRVKLFQIIVNLIKNGIDALIESKTETKQLILQLQEKDDAHFMIEVRDNGIGIIPENLTKIFSQGFTTKKIGHGLGLHNSILYAKEMGGSLAAKSEGIGLGATFTLILPYQPVSKKREQ